MTTSPAQFMASVRRELNRSEDVNSCYAAQLLRFSVPGREVEVGTTASSYWIKVGIDKLSIPEDVCFAFHPQGTYGRAAFESEGASLIPSGDPDFDRYYLLFGKERLDVEPLLTSAIRGLLVSFADVSASLNYVNLVFDRAGQLGAQEWAHLECRPPLCAGNLQPVGGTPMGTDWFTPGRCAGYTLRAIELAQKLESLLRDAS